MVLIIFIPFLIFCLGVLISGVLNLDILGSDVSYLGSNHLSLSLQQGLSVGASEVGPSKGNSQILDHLIDSGGDNCTKINIK